MPPSHPSSAAYHLSYPAQHFQAYPSQSHSDRRRDTRRDVRSDALNSLVLLPPPHAHASSTITTGSGRPRAERLDVHYSAQIPRYVRVSTMMWYIADTVKYFTAQGFVLADGPLDSALPLNPSPKTHTSRTSCSSPCKQPFHADAVYTAGKLILQDKASCFPAVVLAPPVHKDTVVIDATPLYTFEQDHKRFGTPTMMVSCAGCTNVEPSDPDFLTVDLHELGQRACHARSTALRRSRGGAVLSRADRPAIGPWLDTRNRTGSW
ncbi:hypothetical protein B0H14DRAFT_3447862 [Mycena olivaceomarginata]|nr:hypothetical protein B0H14DRAFT_3447862 [Mycena olivaceomarginata]